MTSLSATITVADQSHAVNYTGMRVRFQRSADAGQTWADVQSNVRALGVTTDSYAIPANSAGMYRAGACLTDGTAMSAEVFSSPVTVAVLATPVSISVNILI